jgi:hypothetical protein
MSEYYKIDWDKVQTVDDIKRLLVVLDIKISPKAYQFSTISDLLMRDNATYPITVK